MKKYFFTSDFLLISIFFLSLFFLSFQFASADTTYCRSFDTCNSGSASQTTCQAGGVIHSYDYSTPCVCGSGQIATCTYVQEFCDYLTGRECYTKEYYDQSGNYVGSSAFCGDDFESECRRGYTRDGQRIVVCARADCELARTSLSGETCSCIESTDPDLVASAPSPATATAGTAQTFSATIYNTGSGSTGSSFSNFFQVASAANGGGTVTNLPSASMSSISAGSSRVASASHTFSSAGTYSVRACADKTSPTNPGVISESNESNNCGGWTNVTVTGGSIPLNINNVSISSSTVLPNNTNQYNIVASVTNPAGAQRISDIYTLVNYQGENAGHYRGYLVWYYSNAAFVGYPDKKNCSGYGGAAAVYPSYGTQYIHLDSCSVADNGNIRTVTFTVRFTPEFTAPVTNNDISGYAVDAFVSPAVVANWINFQTNFGLSIPVATASITANPTTVPYNGASTVTWSSTNATSCSVSPSGWTGTSGSQSSGSLTSSRTYTVSCQPSGVSSSANVTVNVTPQTTFGLNVIKSGQGTVTGVSTPGQTNINCGTACQATYTENTSVTLTATPNTGRIFVGWSGDCSGRGTCNVVINGNKTVIANFAIDPSYNEF